MRQEFLYAFWLLYALACGREGIPVISDATSGGEDSSAEESGSTAISPQSKSSGEAATVSTKQEGSVTPGQKNASTANKTVSAPSTGAVIFRLTELPATSANQSLKYAFQLKTDHPKPESLTYTVAEGPEGMVVSSSGFLSWIPGAHTAGVHKIVLKITDAQGSILLHTYQLAITGTCQEGTVLGIWRGASRVDTAYLGEILAYEGSHTPQDNYGYSSSSVHLKVGPVAQDNYGTVFFYRDGQGELNLFFFFSLDDAADGANQVKWDMKVKGNDQQDKILVADDPSDIFTRALDAAMDGTTYIMDFKYNRNSDGGVVGPFRGEDFEVTVTMKEMGTLASAKFYSQSGFGFPLYEGKEQGQVFTLGFKEERTCN